jgi:hypothetical protein
MREDRTLRSEVDDIDEIVFVRELDGEPCETTLPFLSGDALGAVELDGTPGLELVIATNEGPTPVTILDFTP